MSLTMCFSECAGVCLAQPPGLNRNIRDIRQAFFCPGFASHDGPGGQTSCEACKHFRSKEEAKQLRASRDRGGRFRPSSFR